MGGGGRIIYGVFEITTKIVIFIKTIYRFAVVYILTLVLLSGWESYLTGLFNEIISKKLC